MAFDVEAARAEFPILKRQVHGKPLVYLDSAASAQKPQAVIEAMTHAMEHSYANVHRGLHTLANETTDAYEAARQKAAAFINADVNEVVFTKGGTEAVNLVAAGLGARLQAGDEIIVSEMEHHANIVPWHFLRERLGVVLEGRQVQPTVVSDRGPLQDHAQPLAQEVPGHDVGVVLHLRDDDLVAGLETSAEARGHQVHRLCAALGEDDLGGLGADEGRDLLAGGLIGVGGLVGQ